MPLVVETSLAWTAASLAFANSSSPFDFVFVVFEPETSSFVAVSVVEFAQVSVAELEAND